MNYKKQLLKEELEKFNFLNEYDFYTPESLNEEDPEEMSDDDGGEAPEGDMGDQEMDINNDEGGEAPEGEEVPEPEPEMEEPDMDAPDMAEPELPEEDEVEVDITDLVKNSEEEKERINQLDNKLMQTQKILQNIENSFSKMDNITNKLDSMEKEIEKRNPTNQEKLELKSLKSYPYNIKLTDYWGNKEGNYDAMNTEFKKEPEEYVLTQKDIDDDYSDIGIAKTF